MKRLAGIVAATALMGGVFCAPPAYADGGWVAAANSPSHEQMEFAWGIDQGAAESRALASAPRLSEPAIANCSPRAGLPGRRLGC